MKKSGMPNGRKPKQKPKNLSSLLALATYVTASRSKTSHSRAIIRKISEIIAETITVITINKKTPNNASWSLQNGFYLLSAT